MPTTPNNKPDRTLAGVDGRILALAALLAAGCGSEPAPGPFDSHRPVVERIEAAMVELQAQRASERTDADIGEIVAGLRVIREPPEPEPEPDNPAAREGMPDEEERAAATRVELRLQGVAWHPKTPLAIINGRTLGVDESVENHRVDRILQEYVVLTAPDGQTMELRLYATPAPSP